LIRIEDRSGSVDVNSVSLTLDGIDAGGSIEKSGGSTSIMVDRSGQLWLPNQTVTAELAYTAGGEERTSSWSWTTADYLTLPSVGYRTDLGSGSEPGFDFRVHQVATTRANSTPEAEAQLAGERGENQADPFEGTESSDPARPGVLFAVEEVINFDQDGAAQGVFRGSGDESSTDRVDELIPGIPGLNDSTDNIAAEILTFIEFPSPGFYRMIFNSDDGFRVTFGHELDGLQLGVFNGGRGAADTLFGFAVTKAGVYPIRAIWYEGGGGANLEWSSLTGDTRYLINDAEGGLKAFRSRSGEVDQDSPDAPSEVKSITLANGELTIEFNGTLKAASSVTGPYIPVEGASSPYALEPDQAAQFYIAE
jgi:hypothetical protein